MLTTEFISIPGYEGYYKMNQDGIIMSETRSFNRGYKSRPQVAQSKVLKQQMSLQGYLTIDLVRDGVKRKFGIHRLLCMTFQANPLNHPCVNHKDGNKLNNVLENLEWCTYSHNNKHAFQNGLKFFKPFVKSGAENKRSKPVHQYDRAGNLVRIHVCTREAAKALGVTKGAVKMCAARKRNTCQGYILSYEKMSF